MAGFSHENKTEAATPRRLEEARQRGQVAVSPDLTAAVTLLVVAIGMRTGGPTLAEGLTQTLVTVLPALPGRDLRPGDIQVWSQWFLNAFLGLVAGILLGLMAFSLLTTGLQAGLRFSTEPLAPKWSRINPFEGWSRLMSVDGLARGAMMFFKLCLTLGVGGGVLWSMRTHLRMQAHGSLRMAIAAGWDAAHTVVTALAIASLLLAVGDFLFRRYRHAQQLRMSRQEVADESKEDQGDPHLRAQRRSRQREAATRKSLREIPQATVVVTNPTHIAVALQYRPGQSGAPRVIAKGRGRLALRIRELAAAHGVPVFEQKPLARALYRLADVGQEIPVELYHAVAEILARLYRRKHAA